MLLVTDLLLCSYMNDPLLIRRRLCPGYLSGQKSLTEAIENPTNKENKCGMTAADEALGLNFSFSGLLQQKKNQTTNSLCTSEKVLSSPFPH